MSNIVTAKVEIVGKRSLFLHPFGEDSIPREAQERTGVAGNDPWTWAKTTPCTSEGQLFILPTQVFASIREGGSHIKVNRSSLKKPIIATLEIVDEIVLLDRFLPQAALEFVQSRGRKGDPLEVLTRDMTQPVYLDVRGGKNPGSKAGMVIYRVACCPGWHLSFTLQWDKTVVATAQMHSAVIQAGNLEGIGNARKIGKGRFDVVSFQVSESD